MAPYLGGAGELTAKRLITLHKLTFVAEPMRRPRGAIVDGGSPAVAARVLAGEGLR